MSCRWPVLMTRRVAELVTLIEEDDAREERRDSALRSLLWLAGIALSEMDAQDRVVSFSMMLDGQTVRVGACFDTTHDLTAHIIVAGASEWGRGVDAQEP